MPYTPNPAWENFPSVVTPITAATLQTMENGIDTAHDAVDNHMSDTSDAHDASAISVSPAGTISSTDVQAALVELSGDINAGGMAATLFDNKGELLGATAADTVGLVTAATANALVLTSDSTQATGMKWAAGGTAELDTHLNDTADAHDASAISIADAGGYFTGTEVEAALQEVGADVAAAASLALIIALG